jgi:hypothetical protein
MFTACLNQCSCASNVIGLRISGFRFRVTHKVRRENPGNHRFVQRTHPQSRAQARLLLCCAAVGRLEFRFRIQVWDVVATTCN